MSRHVENVDDDKPKKKSKNISVAEIVEELKKDNLLFHDIEDGVGYIAVNKKGDQVFRIESQACQKWLRNWFVKKYKRYGINRHNIEEICAYLASVAEIDGEGLELSVRICKTVDEWGDLKEVIYDTRNGMAVKIDANGWSLIPTPIKFKHFPHQMKQVLPETTDSRNLDILREFVNIEDDSDWLVFLVFVVSTMIPNSPSVLLAMNGDMGAGKSESLRMIVKITDPSALMDGMKMSFRTEDLVRCASKNQILFFDNLSKITDDQSDDLCKVCTGGALTVRRLYTDNDEEVYHFKRPVLISGIPRLIHRSDLNDRSIILTVKRIPENKRKTQAELDAFFEASKPQIMGAIFNVLSDAIKKYKTIQPKEHPRSADWYKGACAIAASIDGYSQDKFELAFKKVKDRQLEYALEESPVAMAAKFIVDKCGGKWYGTATQLLDFYIVSNETLSNEDNSYIQYLQDHPAWPKNASVLGKELARCRPTLEALGIDMIHGENGKSVYKDARRYIQLTDRNHTQDDSPSTLFDITNSKEKE